MKSLVPEDRLFKAKLKEQSGSRGGTGLLLVLFWDPGYCCSLSSHLCGLPTLSSCSGTRGDKELSSREGGQAESRTMSRVQEDLKVTWKLGTRLSMLAEGPTVHRELKSY